ncbi:glycosyltransferase family 4 protein [Glaciecola sp. KUL10]|uniref:glycosyltransferase family 4 protein n=1 Tax=Glaciecola sp. (strain KUL10) TaxID=2161813 RepID=UPI000D7878B9|nr:glycosyltransferase family 4 protein [Glaciecola sp. KUL10]GBL04858.1 glycosyl transferase family protein [Glaciecola sp. KUL10]
MRSDDPSTLGAVDAEEHNKTFYVLGQGTIKTMVVFFSTVFRKPMAFLTALGLLRDMNKASKTSLVKHLIYLVEACIVAKHCEDNAIEHIHTHFGTNPTEVAMYASALSDVKYSFTVHGPEEFDKPLTLNLKLKIQQASSVVAITSYCRSQLYRWAAVRDWHKVTIVHCGLEDDFFEAPRCLEKSKTDCIQMLCIGRLCEQKGQLLLLEAFKQYLDKGFDAHLTLVGDGEMRSDVEAYLAKHRMENKVTITGWVDSDRVKDYLSKTDVMLLPSFAEGLPVAIMEAMATGVPVITTSIAGIPELIINSATGYLVFPGSTEHLVARLVEFSVLTTDEKRVLVKNAFDAVKQEHSVDTETDKLNKVFKKGLA